jgi:hypothetical protein
MSSTDADDGRFKAILEENRPTLTSEDVANLLNVGRRTVLSIRSDGRLRARRIVGLDGVAGEIGLEVACPDLELRGRRPATTA